MKRVLAAFVLALFVITNGMAGEKSGKTCCEDAKATGKPCTHKCCVAAHKAGKSCEKCNPNKEDLKLDSKPLAKAVHKS